MNAKKEIINSRTEEQLEIGESEYYRIARNIGRVSLMALGQREAIIKEAGKKIPGLAKKLHG